MRGSSKVIMGATMAMVIILAFVLGLVLVLLAELYCSLLLRRRKLNASKPSLLPEIRSISSPQQSQDHHLVPSPLSSFYAQGVLEAPRSFLFPKLPSKRENRHVVDDVERVIHRKLHEFLRVQSPHQLGIPSSSSQRQSSQDPEIVPEEVCEDIEASNDGKRENFMYISNPIYDNEAVRTSRVDTPFETPDSSPSRMDQAGSGSSGDEEEAGNVKPVPEPVKCNSPSSLPLTPMKELPNKACSVTLKEARSMGTTSISDSNTHSHIGRSSSSSSGTPCTSPSW